MLNALPVSVENGGGLFLLVKLTGRTGGFLGWHVVRSTIWTIMLEVVGKMAGAEKNGF